MYSSPWKMIKKTRFYNAPNSLKKKGIKKIFKQQQTTNEEHNEVKLRVRAKKNYLTGQQERQK